MNNNQLIKSFKSKQTDEVIKFYDNFNNNEQLINFLKSFPYAPVKIYDNKGESEVAVVITTPDHQSKFSRNCMKIYKGLRIIFAESKGIHFDFSRSCNIGLNYALKSKAKWIVLSNDDMYKMDNPNILEEGLESLNSKNVEVVYRNDYNKTAFGTSVKHLVRTVARPNPLIKILGSVSNGNIKDYIRLQKKFNIDLLIYSNEAPLSRKFYTSSLMSAKRVKVNSFSTFWIFNRRFVEHKNGKVFDETFRNDYEDIDLDIDILLEKTNYDFINYNIGHSIAQTQGAGTPRVFRGITNWAYLCSKLHKNRKWQSLLEG